ncbi:MAG: hypothetical protein AAGC47_13890, partial [Bacteroidota bacterium]
MKPIVRYLVALSFSFFLCSQAYADLAWVRSQHVTAEYNECVGAVEIRVVIHQESEGDETNNLIVTDLPLSQWQFGSTPILPRFYFSLNKDDDELDGQVDIPVGGGETSTYSWEAGPTGALINFFYELETDSQGDAYTVL